VLSQYVHTVWEYGDYCLDPPIRSSLYRASSYEVVIEWIQIWLMMTSLLLWFFVL
jgi:hypothetical protein